MRQKMINTMVVSISGAALIVASQLLPGQQIIMAFVGGMLLTWGLRGAP